MKILAVDDSSTVRETIREMLEPVKAEFMEADNGQAALDFLVSIDGNVDLILLDWEMPVMNGYEFLACIRKDERLRSIPVIMLTSVSQKEKVVDAIRAGVKQYILKPFSSEILFGKIMQVLGANPSSDNN
jgi:two-component system chemotaxis response regulator CheY